MKRTLRRRVLTWMMGAGIAGAAILFLARSFAEDKAPTKPPPFSKLRAQAARHATHEPILNEWVNAVQQPPQDPVIAKMMADQSKFGIESPFEKMVAGRTIPSPATPASAFINPKVEPGKVRWHKTFADACRAAQQSGKPVLLFQMMGNLDERFC